MSEYFVIRLGATSDDEVEWIVADDNGTRHGAPESGSLDAAAQNVAGRAVIVLVPGTDVLTTSVELPIRSTARLHAALPFALEEHLADDVETLHFAAGRRREDGQRPVTVVSREKMDGWLRRLRDAGIEADQIVAENHGLARIPGTMSLLVAGSTMLVNDGADIEFVIQDVLPSDALVAAGLLSDRSDLAAATTTSLKPAGTWWCIATQPTRSALRTTG